MNKQKYEIMPEVGISKKRHERTDIMIGLKMPMPVICLNCPCLHTIFTDGMVVRFCMAEHKELVIVPESETKDFTKWINFSKPKWCPWVEVA